MPPYCVVVHVVVHATILNCVVVRLCHLLCGSLVRLSDTILCRGEVVPPYCVVVRLCHVVPCTILCGGEVVPPYCVVVRLCHVVPCTILCGGEVVPLIVW